MAEKEEKVTSADKKEKAENEKSETENTEKKPEKEKSEMQNTEKKAEKEKAEDPKREKPNELTKKNVVPKPRDDSIIEDNPTIEYEILLNRVKSQNELFNNLKLQLIEMECEECTCCNACCLEQMRCQMEVEKENLRLLVKEIIKFQRDHPNGPWEEIEIATHLSEDNIPDGKDAAMCAAMLRMKQATECKKQRLSNSG